MHCKIWQQKNLDLISNYFSLTRLTQIFALNLLASFNHNIRRRACSHEKIYSSGYCQTANDMRIYIGVHVHVQMTCYQFHKPRIKREFFTQEMHLFRFFNFEFYLLIFVLTGITILDPVKSAVSRATNVVYSVKPDANFVQNGNFSNAIIVLGETPYSETSGDGTNLTITEPTPTLLQMWEKAMVLTTSYSETSF